ncbi:alpha-galactosidase precursor [Elsinoe ampelina]|uniref:Alpha-galactosidase n=1 Tax=Elsinoe ampelina TaxID=302913 RepID=A0A6A6G3V6_9PEZI|nr:alpha-galactosidase precursor [Elsinoe ampelina]
MAVSKLLTLSTILGATTALIPQDGSTGRLPAMGWNNWNEYECNINETVFLTVGKLLIDLGLKDLGYEYVNIDDCWSNKTHPRDPTTNELTPDLEKFPLGISHVASSIHALGLKLGIYSDAGATTCAGYAGSLGHEDIDATTFASWGIDYLKYDNCAVPREWYDPYRWWPENWFGGPPAENQTIGGDSESAPIPAPDGYDWSTSPSYKRYEAMSLALGKQARTVQYSQCAWGHAHIDQWGNRTGQSWRMWGDIYPVWTGTYQWSWGLMPILNHASFFTSATNFFGRSDYDMLEVGNGNLTIEENRSHFAYWAGLKSPLIIGTPLDGIRPEILQILSNKALVDFNQDPVVGQSIKPYKWGVNEWGTWNQSHPAEYWSGLSSKGAHVFILNTLEEAGDREVVFAEVPELKGCGRWRVTDMWTGEEKGVFEERFTVERLARHDTAALMFVKAEEEGDRRRDRELKV